MPIDGGGRPALGELNSKLCVSDFPVLYGPRGFSEEVYPYDNSAKWRTTIDPRTGSARYPANGASFEYPAGMAYFAYGTAVITHILAGSPSLNARHQLPVGYAYLRQPQIRHEAYIYYLVNAVILLMLAIGALWLFTKLVGSKTQLALLALSPIWFFYSLLNWEFLAVFTLILGLYLWRKGKLGWAAVALGLATSVKLYPVFVFAALIIVLFSFVGWKKCLRPLSIFVGTLLAVNVPAMITGLPEWLYFWKFNESRGIDAGSFWLGIFEWIHIKVPTVFITAVSFLFVLGVVSGITVLLIKKRYSPTIYEVAFLFVAAFVFFNKVYSVQYSLWLLPLAVLAYPKWRTQVIWQLTEVGYFLASAHYQAHYWPALSSLDVPNPQHQYYYAASIFLRMAAELYLMLRVFQLGLRRSQTFSTVKALENSDTITTHANIKGQP